MSFQEFEPADDVTDLDTARRMITALRYMIEQTAKAVEPIPGEYHVFLDAEHAKMFESMYRQGTLLTYDFEEGHGNFEMMTEQWGEEIECLTEFVERALDFHHDTLQATKAGNTHKRKTRLQRYLGLRSDENTN